MKRVTMLVMCAVVLLAPGCADFDRQIAQTKLALAQAESEILILETKIETLADGKEKAQLQTAVALIKKNVTEMKTRLDNVDDEIELFEQIGYQTAENIPGQIGGYVGLGVLLIGSVWRMIKKSKQAAAEHAAGVQIAASVEAVLTDEQKAQIKGQGDLARAIVNEAQGKAA